MESSSQMTSEPGYPVRFLVEYPERALNRLTTAFRLSSPSRSSSSLASRRRRERHYASGEHGARVAGGTGALLFLAPLLMILFRQKYPRWWFDWNLELLRFSNRVGVYLALMDDRYPSTDEQQAVALDFPYPDAQQDLNRWLPLVKWLLAIPHYIVLVFLWIAAFVAVIVAWFAILFTGRYPRGLFDFVLGVFRWTIAWSPTRSSSSPTSTRRSGCAIDPLQLARWCVHQAAPTTRSRASPTKMLVSIPCRSQKRLSGM